jgi:phosphoglycolate phosphatase-like HAD superfamily hydrolase
MAAGFRGVVFDFDFTLADASAGIIPAVNGALGDIGLPQLDEARVRAIIGLSLPAVLEELTGITEPPELVDKFAARFIERADSLEDASGGAALSTVLPGVALALAALRAAGLRIAIASTKGRERIAELLQIHGLHGMFDALVGAEDVPDGRLKPEPDALLEAAVSHANVVPCRLPPAACDTAAILRAPGTHRTLSKRTALLLFRRSVLCSDSHGSSSRLVRFFIAATTSSTHWLLDALVSAASSAC